MTMPEHGFTLDQEPGSPIWVEEEFYFGNAGEPSSATYRRAEERIQQQQELYIPLTPKGRQFTTEPNFKDPITKQSVISFFRRYEDVQILMFEGYPTENGGYQPPQLYLIGWQELTTPEEFASYERDKADGMGQSSTSQS